MDMFEQANELQRSSVTGTLVFEEITYLFGISCVESYASVDESPFHVFIKSRTYVQSEPSR